MYKDSAKSLGRARASHAGWQGVSPKPSATPTLTVQHANLLPPIPAQVPTCLSLLSFLLSGRLPLVPLVPALLVAALLDDLGLDGSVNVRVALSSRLEELSLSRRDLVVNEVPSDLLNHDLEDAVKAAIRIAVVQKDCHHLIGVDELLAEAAVEVALDQGLRRLDLEVVDGTMDVDGFGEVARPDLDLEDFAWLNLVDFVDDDSEGLDGSATKVHADDGVRLDGGEDVADQCAVGLDVVAIVHTD